MNEFIERIKSGEFKRVVICSGAGVSTNSGIPDYRSSDGIFNNFRHKYSGYLPEDIFSRFFRNNHPEFLEDDDYLNFLNKIKDAEPTASHHLAKWLDEKGYLKRVYTQNVDRLYLKAGLPKEKLVEFHGYIDFKDDQIIDKIVYYGDDIDYLSKNQLQKDFIETNDVDCMLVMGTSLQVSPFCSIPNLVNKDCTRVLVDTNPENAFKNSWTKARSEMLGFHSPPTQKSFIKVGQGMYSRLVSLRPEWEKPKIWKDQYIIRSDCDLFSKNFSL